eukprot:5023901-Prymnesium_polylepis.1
MPIIPEARRRYEQVKPNKIDLYQFDPPATVRLQPQSASNSSAKSPLGLSRAGSTLCTAPALPEPSQAHQRLHLGPQAHLLPERPQGASTLEHGIDRLIFARVSCGGSPVARSSEQNKAQQKAEKYSQLDSDIATVVAASVDLVEVLGIFNGAVAQLATRAEISDCAISVALVPREPAP